MAYKFVIEYKQNGSVRITKEIHRQKYIECHMDF